MRKLIPLRLNTEGIDYLFIGFLLVGGIAGYANFPSFVTLLPKDITSKTYIWTIFFILFAYVLTYKILNRSFFSVTQAAINSAIVCGVMEVAGCLGVIFYFKGMPSDSLISLAFMTASGVAFLLLTVQSAFKSDIDLRAIEESRMQLAALVENARNADPVPIEPSNLNKLRALAKSLPTLIETAETTEVLSAAQKLDLEALRDDINQISTILMSPETSVSATLKSVATAALKKRLS